MVGTSYVPSGLNIDQLLCSPEEHALCNATTLSLPRADQLVRLTQGILMLSLLEGLAVGNYPRGCRPAIDVIVDVCGPDARGKQQQLMRQQMHGHDEQHPAVRYRLCMNTGS